ncbi:hypothetical protein OBBRIDRAFT_446519 [Obba rivulosa]|uniref:Uncharacterized protein n=1 Tax=Obba rivulosa TaxID=1052685 RepID=A0A8E2DUC4_9APHY|nr:hypothetical protein OBBRIDRAFT_446519 [Obba rivulosa]
MAAGEGPVSSSGRSNVPLIRLAQPQEVIEIEEVFEYDEESFHGGRFSPALSVILERSERTESTADYTPRQDQARSLASRAASSVTTTTDYGQVIPRLPMDPNAITPSPPLSALQRLSSHEPAPSATPTESRTSSSSSIQKAPSMPVPPVDTLPEIPDSKSSLYARVGVTGTSQASLLTKRSAARQTDAGTNGEKKSKLASLASSRRSSAAASSVSSVTPSSVSSRTYSVGSSSVVTYPPLRPSSASMLSLQQPDDQSSTTDESSMSSHVRRAIDTAMKMEELDRAAARAEPSSGSITPTPRAPAQRSRDIPLLVPPPSSPPTHARAPAPAPPSSSRLSQLSQRRSAPVTAPSSSSIRSAAPSSASPAPSRLKSDTPVEPASPAQSGRQPSKLAKLAQAKAQQAHRYPVAKPTVAEGLSHGLITHRSHTEYITPIANGPTATTAITTTYQSLGGLLPISRSGLPSAILRTTQSVPAASLKATPPAAEPKQSKLAMKSRKAQRKPEPEPEPVDERSPVEMAMFAPKPSRTRALPSAFASVLSDEHPLTPVEDKLGSGKRGESRRSRTREQRGEATSPEREKRRASRQKRTSMAHVPPPSSRGFAFDVPSPDDAVFSARQGTALGSRSVPAGSHPSRAVAAGVSA